MAEIQKLTRVRFVYYTNDAHVYYATECDMNAVPDVGDELYLDTDNPNTNIDGWYVKGRICNLKDNCWEVIICHRLDDSRGDIFRFKEDKRLRELLDSKIDFSELTIRASNCLKAADVKTYRELLSCKRSFLEGQRNFGKKSLEELEKLLEKHGLHWGMDV